MFLEEEIYEWLGKTLIDHEVEQLLGKRLIDVLEIEGTRWERWQVKVAAMARLQGGKGVKWEGGS